jgi:hypothetical protein
MASFRLRFRKTIPLIPKVFYITINKKSISWNLRLGPYSRTWGKNHTISTFDAPGEYGASWRKIEQRKDKEPSPIPGILAALLLLTFLTGGLVFLQGMAIVPYWPIALVLALGSRWFFGIDSWAAIPMLALAIYGVLSWLF